MVLVPTDPVAPRMVIRRTAAAGNGSLWASFVVEEWPSAVMRSPYQESARGRIETTAQQSDRAANKRCAPETIETIHHATMTGNELACILGTEPAFDPGFEKIAQLRHH